jgi:hypothetical protein
LGNIIVPSIASLRNPQDTGGRLYIFWAGKGIKQDPFLISRKRVYDSSNRYRFDVYKINNILSYDSATILRNLNIAKRSGSYNIISQIIRQAKDIAPERLSIYEIILSREIKAIEAQA